MSMPAKAPEDELTLFVGEMPLLFPSNHVPNGIEREIIKQRIILSEQKSTGYIMKILEAKRWIIELEQNIAREARDREILIGSLSAVRQLPVEVLSLIFCAYVLENGGSPWPLTRVSSLFRRAVFASPWIWTKIHLRHGVDLEPSRRNECGRENCTNVSQLRMALTRSGAAPLDVEISGFDMDMAREIVKERHRWATLSLTTQQWDHQLLQWLLTETQLPIPVESVVLDGVYHRDYIQRWLSLAQPVNLDLKRPNELVGFTAPSWSARLRVLELHEPAVPFHIPEILAIVAPRLTHLSISHVQLQLELMPASIAFPNLLELWLVNINAWWQFESPNLRKFTLYPTHGLPKTTRLSYPKLKQITFRAEKSAIPSGSLLAPALESLNVQRVTAAQWGSCPLVIPGWFQSPSNMHLYQLWIDECSIPYKELLESLHLLRHLRALCISDTQLPVSFFRALGTTQSLRYGTICPDLLTIFVDFSFCKGNMVKETFVAAFVDIAKAREEKLAQLRVCWPVKWRTAPAEFV